MIISTGMSNNDKQKNKKLKLVHKDNMLKNRQNETVAWPSVRTSLETHVLLFKKGVGAPQLPGGFPGVATISFT